MRLFLCFCYDFSKCNLIGCCKNSTTNQNNSSTKTKTKFRRLKNNERTEAGKLHFILDYFGHSFQYHLKGLQLTKMDAEDNTQVKDVNYFKKILNETNQMLVKKCDTWNQKMDDLDKTLPNLEDVCGKIRSTIGKANLINLTNKKGRFVQFNTLIENCEFNLGEKETTCMDLQGFWEMIYFQVEDIQQLFSELEKLEQNNWIQEKINPIKNPPKKKLNMVKPAKPKGTASSI